MAQPGTLIWRIGADAAQVEGRALHSEGGGKQLVQTATGLSDIGHRQRHYQQSRLDQIGGMHSGAPGCAVTRAGP